MSCLKRVAVLPCGKTGIGYLSQPLNCDQTKFRLMDGQQSAFPVVEAGGHFYVVITTPCNTCCAVFRVTATDANVFTASGLSDCPCNCFPSNSRVEYTTDVREYVHDLVREVEFNVVSPLKWDCETRTLSLDCNELLNKPDCGCV